MTAEEFVNVADPSAVESWAEFELKAVVCGMTINPAFCRYAVVMGAGVHTMTRIVAEGVLSSVSWNCVGRDEGIVDDIFQLFLPISRRFEARLARLGAPPVQELADDLSVAMAAKGYYMNVSNRYIQPITRKYLLLDAIERRFPALPVKYYAANAARIHETDEEFAVWIKQRLAERAKTSEIFRKIYESMAAEFVDKHLNAAVFMK